MIAISVFIYSVIMRLKIHGRTSRVSSFAIRGGRSLCMYSFETAEIRYREELIEDTFFLQTKATEHLALVLPGAGYTTQCPMLYYAINLLTQSGADV